MIPWWTLIIALPVGVGGLIWGWSLGHRAGYDEAEWLFARSNPTPSSIISNSGERR